MSHSLDGSTQRTRHRRLMGNVQGTTLRLNRVVGNKSAPSRFGAPLSFANSQKQGVLFIAQTRAMYYNKHRTRFFPPKRGFIRLA